MKPDRMAAFMAMGGLATAKPAEVGQAAQAVFVMVMTGDGAKTVILGDGGLVSHLPKGGAVILSATVSMGLAEELGVPLHTAGSAMQIFHAGRTKYPNGDNWVCTKVIKKEFA